MSITCVDRGLCVAIFVLLSRTRSSHPLSVVVCSMLLTPLVYQQAGWVLPTVLLGILCVISSYACFAIIEAIRYA
jgi:hypothetical protein